MSSTRALVEWTRFSALPLPESQLVAELDETLARLSLGNVRVVRTERGVLPMGRPPGRTPSLPGVVHAGVAGGAMRAASGYAFLRIQRWADFCARVSGKGSDFTSALVRVWASGNAGAVFARRSR